MICTESEAKTKWCPQTRFVPILDDVALSPANRLGPESGADDYNPSFARCIGSQCMMWILVRPKVVHFMVDGIMETHPNEMGTCGLIRSAP